MTIQEIEQKHIDDLYQFAHTHTLRLIVFIIMMIAVLIGIIAYWQTKDDWPVGFIITIPVVFSITGAIFSLLSLVIRPKYDSNYTRSEKASLKRLPIQRRLNNIQLQA